jgi:hypothetical protein
MRSGFHWQLEPGILCKLLQALCEFHFSVLRSAGISLRRYYVFCDLDGAKGATMTVEIDEQQGAMNLN